MWHLATEGATPSGYATGKALMDGKVHLDPLSLCFYFKKEAAVAFFQSSFDASPILLSLGAFFISRP